MYDRHPDARVVFLHPRSSITLTFLTIFSGSVVVLMDFMAAASTLAAVVEIVEAASTLCSVIEIIDSAVRSI
jgi:ethanolamine utilization microcompartment shell protein EutS